MPYQGSNFQTSISVEEGEPGTGSIRLYTFIKKDYKPGEFAIPIEGVKVIISGPGEYANTDFTDSTGMVYFGSLQLGSYTMYLSKEGYQDATNSANLTSVFPSHQISVWMMAIEGPPTIPTWVPIVVGVTVVGLVLILIGSGRKK